MITDRKYEYGRKAAALRKMIVEDTLKTQFSSSVSETSSCETSTDTSESSCVSTASEKTASSEELNSAEQIEGLQAISQICNHLRAHAQNIEHKSTSLSLNLLASRVEKNAHDAIKPNPVEGYLAEHINEIRKIASGQLDELIGNNKNVILQDLAKFYKHEFESTIGDQSTESSPYDSSEFSDGFAADSSVSLINTNDAVLNTPVNMPADRKKLIRDYSQKFIAELKEVLAYKSFWEKKGRSTLSYTGIFSSTKTPDAIDQLQKYMMKMKENINLWDLCLIEDIAHTKCTEYDKREKDTSYFKVENPDSDVKNLLGIIRRSTALITDTNVNPLFIEQMETELGNLSELKNSIASGENVGKLKSLRLSSSDDDL